MPLFRNQSVEEKPVFTVSRWRVFAVVDPSNPEEKDHHLVGSIGALGGRVSSKIVEFRPETMTAITRSGRKYVLVGPPGHNGDADYVFGQWLRINGVLPEAIEDVTDHYWKG